MKITHFVAVMFAALSLSGFAADCGHEPDPVDLICNTTEDCLSGQYCDLNKSICQTMPTGHGNCFDPEPPGDFEGYIGPLAVYSSCSTNASHLKLLIKSGNNNQLSYDQVKSLKDSIQYRILDYPGVDMVGISYDCCQNSTNAGCLWVHFEGNSGESLEDFAWFLLTINEISQNSSCLGIAVDLEAPRDPRCNAGDPACLPLPACREINCPGGIAENLLCCPQCADYDSTSPRILSVGNHPGAVISGDYIYLEVLDHEEAGECSHDGECIKNGVGYHCTSYDDPIFVATAECYIPLSISFCGCVDGKCKWFHQ